MPKHNDICRWSYKDTKGMLDPYWCKSRIAIYNTDKKRWFDSYWGSSSVRFSFTDDDVNFEKTIIANLDEYDTCDRDEFDYYDEKDTLDLSHSNNNRLYYLRIGAVKSVEKIKSVLQANLEKAEGEMSSMKYRIERLKEKLQNVTSDTWI